MGKSSYVGKLFRELFQFAKKEKVYWIVPLVIILLIIAIVIAVSQTAAPFIYTLF